jgi:hypothetical protein
MVLYLMLLIVCNQDILRETLDVLASHDIARSQYRVCLAMEESEAGAREKASIYELAYSSSFLEICYTLHPSGIAGEHRGKGSNVAWAVRQMSLKEDVVACNMMEEGGVHFNLKGRRPKQIVTVMDADNCLAQDYFHSVNYYYAIAKPDDRRVMMFTPGCVFDRYVF